MKRWADKSDAWENTTTPAEKLMVISAKTRGDRVIWSIVAFLTILSLLAVYSATGSLAYKYNKGNTEYYLYKQIAFIAAGVGIIYFTHLLNYRWFSRFALWLYIISIPLLLFTLIFGANLNDASRWIKLPIVNQTLQTSDVARLALFMYLARLLSRKQRHITDFKKGYLPLLGPVLLTCALIAPANLSTCLLTGATGLMVIFMGGASIRHIVGTIFIALVPVILLVGIAMATYKPAAPLTTEQQQDAYVGLKRTGRIGTWISRIQDFIYAKGDEVPHQLMQAKIAIAKGQWFGRGPGNSEQRNFLPHPYSDFIYAIIVEEYGFIGGVLLVLLYMLFLYRCIKLLQKFPYAFGTFLAMALSITLATQAIANMAVNVGLVPVTGVTLPLVSMGGTSMLFTCFAIGTILSVARNAELLEGKAQAQKAADNTAIEQEEDEEEQQREDIESAKQEGGAHA